MDELLENKILDSVVKNVEKFGECSIKKAAEISFYSNLKLSDQKKLAKKLVKQFHCLTEIKNGEVFVRKNPYSSNTSDSSATEFDWIKPIAAILTAALGYILFKFFLPMI